MDYPLIHHLRPHPLPQLWQDSSTKEADPEPGHVEHLLPAARPRRAAEASGDV